MNKVTTGMLGPIAIIAALSVAAIEYGKSVHDQAQSVEAAQNLRLARQTAMSVADPEAPEDLEVRDLAVAEPSLYFTSSPSSGPRSISVASGTDRWIGAVADRGGGCHYVVMSAGRTAEDRFDGICQASEIDRALP